MSIAVIIPYYQKTPGLLARALRSVAGQVGTSDVRVVIVDDASPADPAEDLAMLNGTSLAISVVRQANAGPAAARNRGLDTLDASVDRVAFLDSDDEWQAEHLSRANIALDLGHDFYFADLLQPGQTVGGFARGGRIDASRHPLVDGMNDMHAYSGDMFDQIISGNVIGTSTVVYDFARFSGQRFDEAFYSAGEDYLFWISLARAGARFCFSTRIEARYGYGVNVYAGSGWGTEGFLRRVHNEMRYRKRLLDLDLNAAQRALVTQKIAVLRQEFSKGFLSRLLGHESIDYALVKAHLRLDPPTLFALPTVAGFAVADRMRGRSQ